MPKKIYINCAKSSSDTSTDSNLKIIHVEEEKVGEEWKRIFFHQLIIGQKVEKNRCNINKKIPLNETRNHERQISFGGKSALSLRQKPIPSSVRNTQQLEILFHPIHVVRRAYLKLMNRGKLFFR
ncbi:30S ribosomal protein S17 [Trichinella spiralis]|uniref:30S ribosomal protein S17 n=1 Tax=Trichinella spiralis TaxID=6334 RepID=UPI0001EFE4BE|nr:30S ribosomal protein S17 [Trichinella spiralis]